MGLGPNQASILPRIGQAQLSKEDFEAWVLRQQISRSAARALGQAKRREAKPKLPKPRKHKKHCPCLPNGDCHSCKGVKCIKAKSKRASKIRKASTIAIASPAIATTATAMNAAGCCTE